MPMRPNNKAYHRKDGRHIAAANGGVHPVDGSRGGLTAQQALALQQAIGAGP